MGPTAEMPAPPDYEWMRVPPTHIGLSKTGMLVWFAAHTNHVGFYPGAAAIAAFKTELSAFKAAKGSVQFTFDRPLPLALVARIVKYRVAAQRSKRKAPARVRS